MDISKEQFMVSKNPKQSEYPWLVFDLMDQHYAVNCEVVASILLLPEQRDTIPDAPPYIAGIFNLRGRVIALLDLRVLLGEPSLNQEYQQFTQMIDQRKQDHLHWLAELKSAVAENRAFELSTDPHQCAFGKWYDRFTTKIDSVRRYMEQIDEPHRKLHNAAIEVEKCRQCDSVQAVQACECRVLEQASSQYTPRVLQLLEETKTVLKSSYRAMVIVLERGEEQIGIMVDGVRSVEPLEPLRGETGNGNFHKTKYVSDIAQSKQEQLLVLMMNDLPLFEEVGRCC